MRNNKLPPHGLRLWAAPLLVALFSQLYFYPFSTSHFRISAGIIVLNVVLLLETEYSPFWLSALSGVFTVFLRGAVDILLRGLPLPEAAAAHLPTLAFHITFGLLAALLRPSRLRQRPVAAVSVLVLLECVGNLVETLVRREISPQILGAILLTALVRTLLATLPLEVYFYHRLFIQESEHQKRYEQLNLLIADIYAEAFYLKKSAADINGVMGKSFRLYEAHRDEPEIAAPALEISRAIHEVGKDYQRLQRGLDCLIETVEQEAGMKLSAVLCILGDTTRRSSEQGGRKIRFSCSAAFDCPVHQYYPLFSVLGNLLSNAADACGQRGAVSLTAEKDGDGLVFTVCDTGTGIAPELLPYIFEAGFTTKYNEKTGDSGAGIGLCHVKSIVESMGGGVSAAPRAGGGTAFTVRLPLEAL